MESNYEQLVKALRHCTTRSNGCVTCAGCPMSSENGDVIECINALHKDAADAIEDLQAELDQWKAAVKGQEDGIKVLQAEVERLQAQLPKQRNLVEVVRCKDCYWNQIQRFGNGKEYCECSRGNSRINNGDWFCPEGEKTEAQDGK